MKQLINTILKIGSLFLLIAVILTTGCQQQTDTNTASTAFDMQKAKSFIDSINTKFEEELRNGDSVALASHYWPDAELFFSHSEPIKGKEIISAWGSTIRMGLRDFTFTTTDITGDDNFLIETGGYEIKDKNKALVDRGNYVVVWKQQNGEWKLYRDAGITGLPAAK
jgi:ketosteroid isomerase-like protein